MNEIERQLEVLIIQYSPLLHAMIKRNITTDYHDGWDAFQDVCLHLWQYIPRKFDPNRGTNLFVYFRKSATNAVMTYKRRHRYRRLKPPIYREYFTDRLFGIVRDKELLRTESLMKQANTPLKKEVLGMYLEGYTPTEIMRVLHISRSCVYNYLNHFKRILQE